MRASESATAFAVSARPNADTIATVTMKSNAFMLESVRLPETRRSTTRTVYMATPTMRTSGSQPEKKTETSLVFERHPVPRIGSHDAEEFPTTLVQLIESVFELPIGDGRNPCLTKSVEIR